MNHSVKAPNKLSAVLVPRLASSAADTKDSLIHKMNSTFMTNRDDFDLLKIERGELFFQWTVQIGHPDTIT